jgi:SAM-dependent methyltransferase
VTGLRESWGAMTAARAAGYLKTQDRASQTSKALLVEVIGRHIARRPVRILDVGCGNAQLYEYIRETGLDCRYTGVDFSEPLLEAARQAVAGDPNATFVQADASTLDGVGDDHDVAVYSHVVEMLGAPERSLQAARQRARAIAIRFFEPPEHDTDLVELRDMDAGGGQSVPYLRWSMSRDHYRLILSKLGCTSVDVYRDVASADQVHVLNNPAPS